MGIKKKIFLGFVIIGFILFLSGCICVFQLVQIEKSLSGILNDNIKSIDLARHLSDETEARTWEVIHIMTNNETGRMAKLNFNPTIFERCLDSLSKNVTSEEEAFIAENLYCNYRQFRNKSIELDSVFEFAGLESRAEYFNTRYKPSLIEFENSITKLREINQEAISQNSRKLEGNFYRIIMPLIIAVSVGLFLIIIFNYFINLYFITPVLSIIRGIKNYLGQKTPYNVEIETKDEINELNHEIKILISHSRKKDNNRPGVFEFGKNP
jgi:hypothetical protein